VMVLRQVSSLIEFNLKLGNLVTGLQRKREICAAFLDLLCLCSVSRHLVVTDVIIIISSITVPPSLAPHLTSRHYLQHYHHHDCRDVKE